METETFIIPDVFLPALINADQSGLEQPDIDALDKWTEDRLQEYEHLHAMDATPEGFTGFHDLRRYGIGAADCSNVIFSIGGRK